MGMLEKVNPVYSDEKQPTIDDVYGYEPISEEEKNNLLMKFLEYLRASKDKDRARLARSRMLE